MSITVRPYWSGEEEYVAQLHKKVYEEEYRWGSAFSDYAMKIARDFPNNAEPGKEELWIAEKDGKPVGSIMLCATDDEKTGQLRLFIVEKEARRSGAGNALIDTLIERAKEAGYEKLVLWTVDPLEDAIRKYEKYGFTETERSENTEWSLNGKTVFEIKMEAALC